MNITLLKFSNVQIGDTSKARVLDIEHIITNKLVMWDEQKMNGKAFKNKTWVPSMQNTNCGFRVQNQDINYFSKYWDGFIFVDVDHVIDDPELFLEHIHEELIQYPFYLASQLSYSKNGFHFIFYIPKKEGTVEEYYTYAAYIYTIIFKDLIPIENYDWHNFMHHQVLKIAKHKWKINENFKIQYLDIKESDINPYFQSQKKHFIELYYSKPDITKTNKLNTGRYSYTFIEERKDNNKFFYFDHTDRWKLFMTLMFIYNENKEKVYEAAKEIMKYSYDDKHKYSELCNFFDPLHTNMDWYKKYENHLSKHPESSTSKIKWLETNFGIKLNDKYNSIINMEENEYLSDYKDIILKSLVPGYNFINVPTGGGKTTFWDDIKLKSITIEPYNSVINDKFDEETYKACGSGNIIDTSLDYQITNYWKFIDFVNTENKFYDYIIVDESHLIGMQSFRNLKKTNHSMIDFKRALDTYNLQFPDTKIILQTATPSNEDYLFNIKNRITFTKPLNKKVNITFEQILTKKDDEYIDNIKSSILYLTEKMYSEGRKIYIYWGNGGINTMKSIKSLVNLLSGYNVAVYHKKNENTYDVDYIRNNKKIGKFDILISSCYFSVGCDLNDEENAGIIIIGNNAVHDDIQVIGRFRVSKDIDVHILPDEVTDINKTDVSQLLYSMRKKIQLENLICEKRQNTMLYSCCDDDDIDIFTYMDCSSDYYKDFERKFEILKSFGYNIKNILNKEFDNNKNCFIYNIMKEDGITPSIEYIDIDYYEMKKKEKVYYESEKEYKEKIWKNILNGERNFKELINELTDRPKLQDWIRIINIFYKYYDLDYMLDNFSKVCMNNITYKKMKDLIRWKMKLEKENYDKVEKVIIENLIENYDNKVIKKKELEIWLVLYYCIWVSNSIEHFDNEYDFKSNKHFKIFNDWCKFIKNIMFIDSKLRNYILDFNAKKEDFISLSIPDFLKDEYKEINIEEKIETYLNKNINIYDIKRFINIKLEKYKENKSKDKLSYNIKKINSILHSKRCYITDKFPKSKLDKYKLSIGQEFNSMKEIGDFCNIDERTVNRWLKSKWILDLN